jgi:SPP1 gp7 family putative phage head morphogenesis protein
MGVLDWIINKKDILPTSESKGYFRFARMPEKTDSGKGLISQDHKSWNKDNGEEFPFDAELAEGLYKNHGLTSGVIDKYVDKIMSGGFYVTSEDGRAKKLIEDFNRDINFHTVLKPWIKEAMIKPHGIIEIAGNKDGIQELKILDGKTIYVKRDNKGKILGYVQLINNEKVEFKEDQIAQLCFNKIANSAYGLGFISQNMRTIDSLISLKKSMETLMRRKANAPIHVKVGTEKEPANPQDIAAIGGDLEYLQDKHEWATGHAIEIKTAYDVSLGDKFTNPIEIEMKDFITGFKIPEVLLGYGNINEGIAKAQYADFQNTIQSLQEEIEKVIEQKIYRRILLANGIDAHVEFEWGQPSDEFTEKRVALYNVLLNNFGISPEFKKEMEKDMAKLLGFKDVYIETPEEQRAREEAQKLPLVPGQNRSQSLQMSAVPTKLNWEELDKKKLNEFLDFEYQKYLDTIVLTTEKDKFLDLIATTEEELKRGYLTQQKINDLRDILKEAFRKNLSVSDIATKLTQNNIVPNLLSEDTKTIQMSAENRSLMVARTETVRLSALGTANYFQEKGYDKYSWVTSLGERTCDQCNSLHGKVFKYGQGPMPPTNTHINCRCSISNVEG